MRLTDSFRIECDDGARVRVVEYTEDLAASSLDGPGSVPGLKQLRTEDGGAVNYQADGTYKVVATGQVGRRVDR